MDFYLLILISTALAFSIFVSAVEKAYYASNKLHIELQDKQGILGGRIFSYLMKHSTQLKGTFLTASVLSMVTYTILMFQFLQPSVQLILPPAISNIGFVLLAAALISTFLWFMINEAFKIMVGLLNPNHLLITLALPFFILYILLFPFVFIIIFLTRSVFKYIIKTEYTEETGTNLLTINGHLKGSIREKFEGNELELDTKIFHNVLEFKSVRVRECMIPRTEITGIEIGEGIDELKNAFVKSGHSKIVVYKNTIDDIIGYCHSSALFKKPTTIQEILTPLITVPETTMANELMIKFIEEHKSLAAVIDEFGGTSGLVSMEDIIEEIFGEIEDEHDEDNLLEQKLDETNYLLSARLEIDYLNDKYGWKLPVGEYDTLGGLILTHTESIPKPGERIVLTPFIFTIQSTLDNRIDVVKMSLESQENAYLSL